MDLSATQRLRLKHLLEPECGFCVGFLRLLFRNQSLVFRPRIPIRHYTFTSKRQIRPQRTELRLLPGLYSLVVSAERSQRALGGVKDFPKQVCNTLKHASVSNHEMAAPNRANPSANQLYFLYFARNNSNHSAESETGPPLAPSKTSVSSLRLNPLLARDA
jgi:hypothetical protein